MEEGRTDDEDPLPGEFRPDYAWIDEEYGLRTRIRFVPPKPSIAESRMDDFEDYLQSEGEYPDLIDIAILHYQIETIHPFVDGNGRVGRLLIVLLLMAEDVLLHPLFYLSSYIRRHREKYTDLLLDVSEEGAWEEWLMFFLNGLKTQADEAFVRAKLHLRLRDRYKEEYVDAPPSVQKLTEAILREPVFTVSRAAELIDMTYPAANSAVKRLSDDGLLQERTGKERYQVFQADEVLNILNIDVENTPSPESFMEGDDARFEDW